MRFTCLIIKLYVNLEIVSNCIQKGGIRLKKIKIPILLLLVVMIFMACNDDGQQNDTHDQDQTNSSENRADSNQDLNENEEKDDQVNNHDDNVVDETVSDKPTGAEINDAPDEISGETSNDKQADETVDPLSNYTAEEIEYARVWLQVGTNQDIDELNVRHISKGEPVNIYDETSADYPEDVISLSGSHMVDGSITYSGNGDGTINVYNVPSHWQGSDQADENFMKEYTKEIINDTELVAIDPGDDADVIKFIELLNIID